MEVKPLILLLSFRAGFNFKMKEVEDNGLNETSWVSLSFYYVWFDINIWVFSGKEKKSSVLVLSWFLKVPEILDLGNILDT